MIEQFPPLVVVGFLHLDAWWQIPDTFSGGQISIEVFFRARFNDLYPVHPFGSHIFIIIIAIPEGQSITATVFRRLFRPPQRVKTNRNKTK